MNVLIIPAFFQTKDRPMLGSFSGKYGAVRLIIDSGHAVQKAVEWCR